MQKHNRKSIMADMIFSIKYRFEIIDIHAIHERSAHEAESFRREQLRYNRTKNNRMFGYTYLNK